MKLIGLLLFLVSFNGIYNEINSSLNFENSSIFATTKIVLTVLTNGENLGTALKIIFENQEFSFEQTNPAHACQLAQTEKIPLSCLSSNDDKGRWVIDITTMSGEFKGYNNYEITINQVETPRQGGQIKSNFIYWLNENPIIISNFISFTGLNTPTIKVKLDNPTLGKNTNYNYEFVCETAMNISLDVYLVFPMYNEDAYLSSFISQFGNNDEKLKLKLINLNGLNPDSIIQILDKTIVKIENAFPSGIFANIKYSFTLQNILSPAEQIKNNFRFELRDKKDNINQFKAFNVPTEKAGNLIVTNLSFTTSRINTLTQFTLSFQTEEFKPPNTVVDILFPEETYIKKIPNNMMFATGKINLDGALPIEKLINHNHPLNSNCFGLRIKELFRDSYAEKHSIHSFLAYGLQTPNSTRPVHLSLSINNSLFQVLYAETEKFTIKATPGEINNISINLSDSLINKKGNISISFRITDAILISGKIEVTLPDELRIASFTSTDCFLPIVGLQTAAQCQADEHKFTVTKLSQLEIDANTYIEFTIPNVSNPSKCIQMSSVILQTKTEDDYIIDESIDENNIQITPGLFPNVQLKTNSKNNYAVTIYEFTLQTANFIEPNGGFVFIFPQEIGISSSFTCSIGYECQRNEQIIKVKSFSKQAIPALSLINITFTGIINPRSLKVSNPIEIYSVSSDDYMIDTNDKKTFVTNENQIILSAAQCASNSYNTYDEVLFTFTVTVLAPLNNKDQLILTIPNDYPFMTPAKVLNVYGTGKLSPLLTIKKTEYEDNAALLYITLTFHQENDVIESEELLTFQLNGLRNPVSVKPLVSFEYSFLTEDGFNIMKAQTPINPVFTISQFNSITILPEENIMNSIENYNLVLKTYIPLISDDYLIIIYPEEIIPQSEEIKFTMEDYPGITIKSSVLNLEEKTYTFQFTVDNTKSQEKPIKITFNEWKSNIPLGKSETSTFKVFTETALKFKKEENKSDIIITFKCLFPCEKCSEDKSFCTKCYASGIDRYLLNGKCFNKCPDSYIENDIDNTCVKCDDKCKKCIIAEPSKCTSCSDLFPYYNKETFECLTNCPTKTYADDKKICLSCFSTCETCATTADNCLSCINEFPYIYNNKCYVECPSKTVEVSNKICADCDSSCKTCINSPTTCSSCNSPYLLLKNQCVDKDQCSPELNLFPDFDNNKCLDCQEGCKICGNTVTECALCDTGYIQKGKKCYKIVESCPDGFFLTTEKICQECNRELCNLCDQTPTTCTKCNQGLFLEQSKCVIQCSKGFYLNTTLSQCLMCNSLCEACSSKEICLSCKSNLVLLTNSCITESECLAMTGYYLYNKNCIKCAIRNCDECTVSKCTTCSFGFYLLESICLGACPSGYIKEEASRTCIKNNMIIAIAKENLKFKSPIKHPFDAMFILILLSMPIIVFGIVKFSYPQAYYLACCISFICPLFFITNILLFAYTFYSGEIAYFYTIAIIFLLDRLITFAFAIIYVFYIYKDKEFAYWKSSRPFTSILYYVLIHFIDYKMIRLIYSRLCSAKMFNASFSTFNKIHTPYRIVAVVQMIIVYLPLCIICSIIISTYKSYSSLYYVSLYNIIIIVILTTLMIIDLIVNHDLDLDFFNQKKQKPDVIPNKNTTNNNNDKPTASFRFDLSEIGSEINQRAPSMNHLKDSKISGCNETKSMNQSIQLAAVHKGSTNTTQDRAITILKDGKSDKGKETELNDYTQVDCNPSITDRTNTKDKEQIKGVATEEQSPVRKEISFTNLNPTQIISFGNPKALKAASFNKEIIASQATKDKNGNSLKDKEKDFQVHDFGQLEDDNQESSSKGN